MVGRIVLCLCKCDFYHERCDSDKPMLHFIVLSMQMWYFPWERWCWQPLLHNRCFCPLLLHAQSLLPTSLWYCVPELQINCIKLSSIDSTFVISSPNSMFDHLLESSRWDYSNKWSNIRFSKEMNITEIKICTLSGALVPCALWTLLMMLVLHFNPQTINRSRSNKYKKG